LKTARQRFAITIERTIYALAFATAIWLLVLLCSGCARFHSEQVEITADGTKRTTHIYVLTLFDAQSDLTKLRASTTEKTQGLSLAGLSESSSGTNFVRVLELLAAIAAASAK
jgi:hypothetical protein